MDIFFTLIGLLGIIASVVVLIIFGIQKKSLKIPFIVLGVSFVFLILGPSLGASSPGMFFGMLGLLGLIATIVVLIVFSVQKKPLKIPFIVLGSCIVLFVFGIAITDTSPSAATSTTQSNEQVITDKATADKAAADKAAADKAAADKAAADKAAADKEAADKAAADKAAADKAAADKAAADKAAAEAAKPKQTMGQKNALSKARSYLNYTAFSYSGLIEQLKYEGFNDEDSTYGADNCAADWNQQAAKKAQSYLKYSSFSRSGLIEQLMYEGFTNDQAEYGATTVGY